MDLHYGNWKESNVCRNCNQELIWLDSCKVCKYCGYSSTYIFKTVAARKIYTKHKFLGIFPYKIYTYTETKG